MLGKINEKQINYNVLTFAWFNGLCLFYTVNFTEVQFNFFQEEKYEKMSSGLRNRIVANHAEDDTDYVYIDCFGR